jgi:hypothetical protein
MPSLLALNNHGFPSDDHVLRNRENAAGKQRPKISLQPQAKIGPPGGIAQLFDAI